MSRSIHIHIAVRFAFIVISSCVAFSSLAVDQTMGAHHHEALVRQSTSTPVVDNAAKHYADLIDMAMSGMNNGMDNANMTGNPDHDFAAMMIPHHQGAVDMAKAELLYGKNPVLRRLAQEIIVTQDSEIQVMQSELQKKSSPLLNKPDIDKDE